MTNGQGRSNGLHRSSVTEMEHSATDGIHGLCSSGSADEPNEVAWGLRTNIAFNYTKYKIYPSIIQLGKINELVRCTLLVVKCDNSQKFARNSYFNKALIRFLR